MCAGNRRWKSALGCSATTDDGAILTLHVRSGGKWQLSGSRTNARIRSSANNRPRQVLGSRRRHGQCTSISAKLRLRAWSTSLGLKAVALYCDPTLKCAALPLHATDVSQGASRSREVAVASRPSYLRRAERRKLTVTQKPKTKNLSIAFAKSSCRITEERAYRVPFRSAKWRFLFTLHSPFRAIFHREKRITSFITAWLLHKHFRDTLTIRSWQQGSCSEKSCHNIRWFVQRSSTRGRLVPQRSSHQTIIKLNRKAKRDIVRRNIGGGTKKQQRQNVNHTTPHVILSFRVPRDERIKRGRWNAAGEGVKPMLRGGTEGRGNKDCEESNSWEATARTCQERQVESRTEKINSSPKSAIPASWDRFNTR